MSRFSLSVTCLEINCVTLHLVGYILEYITLLSVGRLPRTYNVAQSTLCQSVRSKTAFLPDAVISVGAQLKDEIWITTNYMGQV